jgi:pyridoxine kinase
MAGGMTIGKGLEESMAIAVDYTLECIRATTANAGYNWYGVDFETAIPYLVRRIGK